jgi:hypothetical protein
VGNPHGHGCHYSFVVVILFVTLIVIVVPVVILFVTLIVIVVPVVILIYIVIFIYIVIVFPTVIVIACPPPPTLLPLVMPLPGWTPLGLYRLMLEHPGPRNNGTAPEGLRHPRG